MPDLIPADAHAPAHERLQKPLGLWIHRNICQRCMELAALLKEVILEVEGLDLLACDSED